MVLAIVSLVAFLVGSVGLLVAVLVDAVSTTTHNTESEQP